MNASTGHFDTFKGAFFSGDLNSPNKPDTSVSPVKH